VIRREDLKDLQPGHVVIQEVRAGEPLRIKSLGMLNRVKVEPKPLRGFWYVYRLTLTVSVAKAEKDFVTHSTLTRATHRDVRLLASSLGESVEVWSPDRGGYENDKRTPRAKTPGALITTIPPRD
jgi:hypothetical protein